jgi:hypothetical protein
MFCNVVLYCIALPAIIVQVRYIIIETKEIARIGYNWFLFLHSYSGNGIGATHLGLHLSTHAEKETRYIQYGQLLYIKQSLEL